MSVDVLAVVHGANVPAGTFADVVGERGHALDVWSLAWDVPPPLPLDEYGAVLVLGGAMHADQDDLHPWLRMENLFLQRLLALHVPVLGVCLGAQLIAKAAHAEVRPASEPEVGWVEVELTEEAALDPLLGELPDRFDAFEWHFYSYDLPAGATELARSRVCTQAFRLGDAAWGVQFHPEVTLDVVSSWAREPTAQLPSPEDAFLAEAAERIEGWTALGRTLCGSFLDVAERVGAPV